MGPHTPLLFTALLATAPALAAAAPRSAGEAAGGALYVGVGGELVDEARGFITLGGSAGAAAGAGKRGDLGRAVLGALQKGAAPNGAASGAISGPAARLRSRSDSTTRPRPSRSAA